MKKLSLIWIPLLLWFAACREKPASPAVDQWAEYRKAYSFLNKHDDSAFYYFNKAASNSTDKNQVASAYQSMAFIQSNAGDHYGAQESLTMSLKALDEHDPKDRDYLARDYNGLGMTYSSLNDYQRALAYYRLALQYAGNAELKSNVLNNQGNAYKNLKAYGKALMSYEAAIKLTGIGGGNYARTLTNQAITKWLDDHRYNAAPELMRSLAIRLRDRDIQGENSSYAHLAEFYMDSKPDSAKRYAKKMLSIGVRLHNGDDQLYALRKLIALAPPRQAAAYFGSYQRIEDSSETRRNAAKNQFAVIRYNVEKQKVENIRLQQENIKRRYQLIAIIASAILIIAAIMWWFKKRRERLKLEAEIEIKRNKLLLSQRIHDDLSNGIYRVMSELEHSDPVGQHRLIQQLDIMYTISRNISYDGESDIADFDEHIADLLNAFKGSSIKLATEGNEPDLWRSVNGNIKSQVSLILQELMVNMSKHSEASFAAVKFSLINNDLNVEYRDNGVGLPKEVNLGNGLRSAVSRIKGLNGTVTFGEADKGASVLIVIPLA